MCGLSFSGSTSCVATMSDKKEAKGKKKSKKKKVAYPLVYNGQDEYDLALKAEYEVMTNPRVQSCSRRI